MTTGIARGIAIVSVVAGMLGFSAANVAAVSPSAPPPASSVGMPHGPHSTGASPATATAGMHWVDGLINQNATFLYGNPVSGWLVGYDSAYVGYYADTDSSSIPIGDFPQVGDVYYMHVVVAVVGNPGSGGDIANIEIALPDNTELALSAANPLHCYFIGASATPTACTTPSVGTTLPIWLGSIPVASYYMFEEQFPVVTTVALNGISNPESYLGNYNTWAIGEYGSGTEMYDWEAIWVPPVAVDTTITSKPASSTSSTSASFMFTSNLGGSSFDCSLDGGPWATCASPKNYSGLAVGSHNFRVAAVDGIGHVDPTPASYTWTITTAVGPATHFGVSTANPCVAGVAQTLKITARDANGYTATGYTGTVHFTSSDARAVLPANATLTNGVGTFSVTLKTAGTQWVRATDTVSAAIVGAQNGIVVNPGPANHFAVSTANPYVAGVSHTLTITARDASGNTATGYLGTVHFTSSDGKAVLPANYHFSAADKGIHKFTITLKTAGTQWVRATDTVTAATAGVQNGIVVTAGAANHFGVSTVSPYVAGVTHTLTITARDPNGNTATGYLGTVHFTSSDSKAVLPANYHFTAADKGIHKFTITLKTKGSQWVRVTDTVTAAIVGSQTVSVT